MLGGIIRCTRAHPWTICRFLMCSFESLSSFSLSFNTFTSGYFKLLYSYLRLGIESDWRPSERPCVHISHAHLFSSTYCIGMQWQQVKQGIPDIPFRFHCGNINLELFYQLLFRQFILLLSVLLRSCEKSDGQTTVRACMDCTAGMLQVTAGH